MKTIFKSLALLALACGSIVPVSSQTIRLQGPDTLVDLGRKWAVAYASEHPGTQVQFTGGGVAAAFGALQERKTDIAIAPRSMRFKEAQACETALGRRPADYKLGVNGLAVQVNADNPVKVLTYDELEGVFRGKYTNWKDVGGADAAITVYGPETNSAAFELFKEEVLNGKDFTPNLRILSSPDLLKAIAQDKNGIACNVLAQANGVRSLAIKRAPSSTPVEPSEETIAKRIYPITRYLFGYLNPASNQGGLKAFVDWTRSDAGQKLVKDAGFYPLPPKLRQSQ
jgi:phosphate transport system substrate-binding protein